MLVELAIGDAYGAGFEYVNRQLIRQFNNLSSYHKHPRHSGTHPGMYTDDTQMTLAIAELMVEGAAWTPANIAQKFVTCFKRDMREGYAGRFYEFLKQVQDGEEFLAKIRPESDKSGAAMRAAPLGIYPTIAEVLERCRIQAAVTHNTPDGIHAACAAALLAHYCFYNLGALHDAGKFIEAHVPGEWADAWRGQVGPKGWMSVKAAISVVQQHTSLAAMLKASVDYSGDVDTVATIALGAAACSPQVAQDLPQNLIDDLENGAFGRDYLQILNSKLMALVKP
jgi:ADP-ribosyl-[dinitrogen reductase] hydrolase